MKIINNVFVITLFEISKIIYKSFFSLTRMVNFYIILLWNWQKNNKFHKDKP